MNVAELKIKLEELGIPKNAYSLPGDNSRSALKSGGFSLQYMQYWPNLEEWNLCINVRRKFFQYASFYSESGACETLYFLLCEDYSKEALLVVDENPQMNVKTMIETLDRKKARKKEQGRARARGNSGMVSYFLSRKRNEDRILSLEYNPECQLWRVYCGSGGDCTSILDHSFHTESTACEEFLKIMEHYQRRDDKLLRRYESIALFFSTPWCVCLAFSALIILIYVVRCIMENLFH